MKGDEAMKFSPKKDFSYLVYYLISFSLLPSFHYIVVGDIKCCNSFPIGVWGQKPQTCFKMKAW